MFINRAEINKILIKYWDPGNPISFLLYKNPDRCVRLDFAIVENNQDPEKQGRLKLHFPLWGDHIISGWVPMARPYAGNGGGFWALPEIGDMVFCIFFNDNPSKPIVLGCLYSSKAQPPVRDNKGNNKKMFTTKGGSKIVFDDTDGEEKLLIHNKDGKMRLVLDKNKGLSVVNESGEIKIKCRKLLLEAGDAGTFNFKKELKISCQGDVLSLKTGKGMSFKAGKDVVCKGTKIKLKGSSGVTAGVKQIAKQDDQVLGVDFHQIEVPTTGGLTPVPMIPHPYLGKLVDKLSSDVTVNDKAAAVKGSQSKYSTPGHIPMPPGVKFSKNPSNEGVVSSGTEPSVKINGKEAAVLGSMVKTCSDPVDQETCTIVALGVSVPLPIFIPGMDKDTFEKDGGTIFNTREPIAPMGGPMPQDVVRSLNNPRWSSGKAAIGDEVTLSVQLSNQYEMANVYFSVWREGADREKDVPLAKLNGQNIDGRAEVTWRYDVSEFVFEKEEPPPIIDFFRERLGIDVAPEVFKYYIEDYEEPYKNPSDKTEKFFFTCKSFKCEEVESGLLEVGDDIGVVFYDASGKKLKGVEYKIMGPDGKKIEGTTGEDGTIEEKAMIPGQHRIQFEYKEGE